MGDPKGSFEDSTGSQSRQGRYFAFSRGYDAEVESRDVWMAERKALNASTSLMSNNKT